MTGLAAQWRDEQGGGTLAFFGLALLGLVESSRNVVNVVSASDDARRRKPHSGAVWSHGLRCSLRGTDRVCWMAPVGR